MNKEEIELLELIRADSRNTPFELFGRPFAEEILHGFLDGGLIQASATPDWPHCYLYLTQRGKEVLEDISRQKEGEDRERRLAKLAEANNEREERAEKRERAASIRAWVSLVISIIAVIIAALSWIQPHP